MMISHKRSKIFFCVIFLISISIILSIYYLIIINSNAKLNLKQHLISAFKERLIKEIATNYTILLWTEFFGQNNYITPLTYQMCPVINCEFTSDRTMLNQSDALILHLRDLKINDLPNYRSINQRWILLNHESPPHSPQLLHHLDGKINWTITYRQESDINLTPKYKLKSGINVNNFLNMKSKVDYSKNKTKLIVWLASNCKTASKREEFVEELRKTVTIDIYGQCGDKQCLPKMSSECWKKLSKEYRFALAFENSICRDYVTEKFFHPLKYDIIPVVFGGADYSSFAPRQSFIDALLFDSPKQLGKYIIQLSKNPEQYNSYFNWKQHYEVDFKYYHCEICKKLNDPFERNKVWFHLHNWWFDQADCRSWNKPET